MHEPKRRVVAVLATTGSAFAPPAGVPCDRRGGSASGAIRPIWLAESCSITVSPLFSTSGPLAQLVEQQTLNRLTPNPEFAK